MASGQYAASHLPYTYTINIFDQELCSALLGSTEEVAAETEGELHPVSGVMQLWLHQGAAQTTTSYL